MEIQIPVVSTFVSFSKPFGYNFSSTTFFAAFLVTGFSHSTVKAVYEQKCPEYQGFLNFQFSYMLRDTLGALPSIQIM